MFPERFSINHVAGIMLALALVCPRLQAAPAQAEPPSGQTAKSPLQTTAEPDLPEKMPTALSRQLSSASAMRSSVGRQQQAIARQRQALSRQAGETTTAGFFLLAPLPPATRRLRQTPPPPDCDPLPEPAVDQLVHTAAEGEGVAPELIRSVMKQESAFKPCAVSSKGAMGLMQLMPETANSLHVKDPFNPVENITGGTRLLKQLLEKYGGNLALTLGAYNAGPERVDQLNGLLPNIPETTSYVDQILKNLQLPAGVKPIAPISPVLSPSVNPSINPGATSTVPR